MMTVTRIAVFTSMIICWVHSADSTVPNLTEACYKCLCQASTRCVSLRRCHDGFCGPFHLSEDYWIDAGMPTLPNDDPEKKEAFEACAKNYECAKTIVEGYLERFSMDCNGDGVIDCLDHMMVNANGGYDCTTPLNTTEVGKRLLNAYEKCKHTLV